MNIPDRITRQLNRLLKEEGLKLAKGERWMRVVDEDYEDSPADEGQKYWLSGRWCVNQQ